MSITRERLDELVKQKAKIYSIGKSNNVFCIGLKFRDCYKNTEWWETKMQHYCDCYYETQKEAEFVVKYTKIPRYLNLPTWEEIQKVKFYEFFVNEYDYMLQYQPVSKKIALYEMNNKGDYFLGMATEENYYKALDWCVKLWKGEK